MPKPLAYRTELGTQVLDFNEMQISHKREKPKS